MPAMSVVGAVGCLPGRTIAFRRQILLDYMDRFLAEKFLGVFIEVSGDRTLTNYTLMDGYRTAYQSTSMVYTDAPLHLKKLAKQQYRWARGSQYNTLANAGVDDPQGAPARLVQPGPHRHPVRVPGRTDRLVSATTTGRFRPEIHANLPCPGDGTRWLALLLNLTVVIWVILAASRIGGPIAHRPGDLIFLPLFIVINIFVLRRVRLLGFFRCARNAGWATRADSFRAAHVTATHWQRSPTCSEASCWRPQ